MKKIFYVHGLGSSANSSTYKYLKENLKEYNVIAYDIPSNPFEATNFLLKTLREEKPDLVVGSSLGGFYAMCLKSTKLLLINPAMRADEDIANAIGKGIYKYSSHRADNEEEYVIDDDFIDDLYSLRHFFYDYTYDYGECSYETYALFGTNDELFSHIEDYKKLFNEKQMRLIPTGHHLHKDELHYIVDYIQEII